MTIKIYDTQPHQARFTASVFSAFKGPNKGEICLVLDRTAFFAEGGGQACDTGEIGLSDGSGDPKGPVFPVTDVQEKEETVYHYMQIGDQDPDAVLALFGEGCRVIGQIDYEKRFDRMQQHSGEHIFSGLAHSLYGCTNVGFHLGDQVTTLDLDKELNQQQIDLIEEKTNRVIYQDLPILVFYPSKEELASMDYRSKKELTGRVRIVDIGQNEQRVDRCACCAPHTASTGEIGMVRILRWDRYKGGVRITIVCGMRALKAVRERMDMLRETADLLTTNQDQVSRSVAALKDQLKEEKEKVKDLSGRLIEAKAESLKKLGKDQKNLVLTEPVEMAQARKLVNELMPGFEGLAAVLMPAGKDEYTFLIGSESADMTAFIKEFKEVFSVRGGGKGKMVQGSVTGQEETLVNFLYNWR
jgi:alanyl-tRNA synthetase